jgi:hypothetical protein
MGIRVALSPFFILGGLKFMKIKIHLLRMLIACAVAAGLMFGAAACVGGGGDNDDAPAQEDTQPNDPSTDTPGGGTDEPSTDIPSGGVSRGDCDKLDDLKVGDTCRVQAGWVPPTDANPGQVYVEASVVSVDQRSGEDDIMQFSCGGTLFAPIYDVSITLRNLHAVDASDYDWTLVVYLLGPRINSDRPNPFFSGIPLTFGPRGSPTETQEIPPIRFRHCDPFDQLEVELDFVHGGSAQFAVGGS